MEVGSTLTQAPGVGWPHMTCTVAYHAAGAVLDTNRSQQGTWYSQGYFCNSHQPGTITHAVGH